MNEEKMSFEQFTSFLGDHLIHDYIRMLFEFCENKRIEDRYIMNYLNEDKHLHRWIDCGINWIGAGVHRSHNWENVKKHLLGYCKQMKTK